MTDIEMFHAFRHTIDEYVFPLLMENKSDFRRIECEGQTVGFLMVNLDGYIEGLWIHPDFQRRGLARKAIYEYVRDVGLPWRLHIVNTNKPAKKFWHGVFDLAVVGSNEIDTLYEVVRCKL